MLGRDGPTPTLTAAVFCPALLAAVRVKVVVAETAVVTDPLASVRLPTLGLIVRVVAPVVCQERVIVVPGVT